MKVVHQVPMNTMPFHRQLLAKFHVNKYTWFTRETLFTVMIILLYLAYLTFHFTTPDQLTTTLIFDQLTSRIISPIATHDITITHRVTCLSAGTSRYTVWSNCKILLTIAGWIIDINNIFRCIFTVVGVLLY